MYYLPSWDHKLVPGKKKAGPFNIKEGLYQLPANDAQHTLWTSPQLVNNDIIQTGLLYTWGHTAQKGVFENPFKEAQARSNCVVALCFPLWGTYNLSACSCCAKLYKVLLRGKN